MRPVYLIGSIVLSIAPAASGGTCDSQDDTRHVRCLDRRATALVAAAEGHSPTVRRFVAEIEKSDLIVYIRLDSSIDRYSGETRLLTAAPGARYALVQLNPRAPDDDLIPLLAHELRHAVEIAEAGDVRSPADVRRLFQRIGWRAGENRYETTAAIMAGRLARLELAATGGAVGTTIGGW